MASSPPAAQSGTRFVCLSDTHSKHELLVPEGGVVRSFTKLVIPTGDVLIHAGDFTMHGHYEEVCQFVSWLKKLPHRWKIIIAGNHERVLDTLWNMNHHHSRHHSAPDTCEQARRLLCDPAAIRAGIVYLEEEAFVIPGSNIKVYGSPYQTSYHDWAFNVSSEEESQRRWNLIPPDTDILITHEPPQGILDEVEPGVSVGSAFLREAVLDRVKPSFHVFGHIHQAYGTSRVDGTTFINASTCTRRYKPENPAIVFDFLGDNVITEEIA